MFFYYILFFLVLFRISKKNPDALKNAFIYIIFLGSMMSVITLNDSKVVKNYPKLLIITYGFEFAKMMGMLQVSHVLNSPFKAYRPVFLIPLLSVLIHSIIFYFTGKAFIINVDVLLCASFVWNVISWAHFVYFCIQKFFDK